ncbi:MAG: 2-oxoglutarate dehydrogenase complex dihydrolipoyllysine-residue succinyltransferase, partial [Chloroflexi bacterium]|nr:2-oxoglutarate dehydrogenase complex dihydrolipoyllysine-residue succinyltransferase [Chloroflexota bacterium]
MAVEIRVPTLGESVVEATVGRWLKREGEVVGVGEPLVELETEKVSTEVSTDEAGVVEHILQPEGATVRVGDVLAVVSTDRRVAPGPPAEAAAPATEQRVRASPVAQRLAAELRVDLAGVAGSGPGGRVMKEDVLAAAERPAGGAAAAPPSAPAAAPGALPSPPAPLAARPAAPPMAAPPAPLPVAPGARAETRQRLSRRRLTIARRLVEAQRTAAMLTTFNEVDMSAIVALRQRHRASFRERFGVSLGYMSFFVKAIIGALKQFPQLNAELQGEELVIKHYYDIGIAIGDPEGLVVPVLRDAERMTFAQVEQAIGAFVEKARTRTLTLDDLRGGTFTITNGGVFGSLLSTPILNPPQVGILGMHKISDRPAVVAGQIAVRPIMIVALTYDHRVVDG